jgi:serine/alanine racemase
MSIRRRIIDYSRGNSLHGFWRLYRLQKKMRPGLLRDILTFFMSRSAHRHGGYIGPDAVIKGALSLPHGLHGIFISRFAVIGENCWIYQNATIGESARRAPVIGDGCLIGAGAVLIGDIKIGNHVKIGAGAVVTTDIPDGCTVVSQPARILPPDREEISEKTGRAWIEVNTANLRHNVRTLQNAMPAGCRLMAVVKAQAYGHGAYEISCALNQMGVSAFAAASIDEALLLRRRGIRGEILILGHTDTARARQLQEYDLMQTLTDLEYAGKLNSQGIPVRVHIKIDMGMHRLGLAHKDVSGVREVFGMKYLDICGMYTHLCCADSRLPEDEAFTRKQIKRFYNLSDALAQSGIRLPKLHIQSSYGFLNYPETACDYIRAGVALYGVYSSPGDETRLKLDLRPVLSLKSRIVLVRNLKKGSSAGYGRAFTAQRDSRIAILAAGYGDGYPRSLSCGRGSVLVRGQRVPVIGRVCMDQMAIDITDVKDAAVGDTALLIGEEIEELTAPAVAGQSGSISNELLCRLGQRLPVILA